MPRFLALLSVLLLSANAYSYSTRLLKSKIKYTQFNPAAKTGLAMLREQPDNLQAQSLAAVALQHHQRQKN